MQTYPENQKHAFEDDTEQIVYKILEENDKILLDPDKYTLQNGMIPEREMVADIEEIFPKMMNGELKNR